MENNCNNSSWWPQWSFWNITKAIFVGILLLNVGTAVFLRVKNYQTLHSPENLLVSMIEVGYDDSEFGSSAKQALQPIADADEYVEQLEAAAENSLVKAIVLKINSPGGYPAPCEIIGKAILEARKQKPVFACVENICASGAYWIASFCDKIIAPQTALIGSIGVISQTINAKDLATRLSLKTSIVKSGKYKAVGAMLGDPEQPWEKQYREDLSNDTYKVFTESVAQNRNLNLKHLNVWADGQIFIGHRALTIGLIDFIGGQKDTAELIKKHYQHEGKVIWLEKTKPTLVEKLTRKMFAKNAYVQAMESSLQALTQALLGATHQNLQYQSIIPCLSIKP